MGSTESVYKDTKLVALAKEFNIAQFVSFGPGTVPSVRHCLVRDVPENAQPRSPVAAVSELFYRGAQAVNVRSYLPDRSKGNPFHVGLEKADDAVALVNNLAFRGYFTIVNEAIDLKDGGVSGVALGDIVEFVPEDTPRGVEAEGVASLSSDVGLGLLEKVYGLRPRLPLTVGSRIEFSLHPSRVGYRREHSIVWEVEEVQEVRAKYAEPSFAWPNRFSRFVGDKAFGLLVADTIGLPVPRTTVIGRHVAPFTFGRATGTGEIWTRPCPAEQKPGLYPTFSRWVDPSLVFQATEPPGNAVVSILAQEGVSAEFSGATLPGRELGENLIEGVRGSGEEFMLGAEAPLKLPAQIRSDVDNLLSAAEGRLGRPVRMEWVHDGKQPWVVQFHTTSHRSQGAIIAPGTPANGWLQFFPHGGLDGLRRLLEQAVKQGRGIEVVGRIGVTSHVGDLLRKSEVPARFAPPTDGTD